MALPPGIVPKTVTVGIASFFDGSLAEGTATITAPVNVVHTPSNRPIFSSQMSHRFVDGETSFNLAPTDAPGLNRVDWTYKLNVVISGALVQPDPIYFVLPEAGPDEIDLDSLVTVPSSAGTPVSVSIVTSVNGQTGDVTVEAGGGTPADGSITPAQLSFDPATQTELDALSTSTNTALGTKVNSSTYTAGIAARTVFDGPTVAQSRTHAFDPRTAAYNFTQSAFRIGRSKIAAARAGLAVCDIAVYADSRAQGSALSPTNKAYETAWPALLRKRLTGSTNGGMVVGWDNITDYDDRVTSSGTWALQGGGPFDLALQKSTDGTKTFTGTFDSIAVYALWGAVGTWRYEYQLDGGAWTEFVAGSSRIGSTAWSRHVFSAGTLGVHTFAVRPKATTSAELYFGGFEPMVGTTSFRVHSIARAGYEANRLTQTDGSGWRSLEATWAWKAPHIGIIDLAINAYNNQQSVASFKTQNQTVITKIKLSGDPVLVAPYDYPSGPAQTIPLSSYISTYYDLADENNCPLIDLNHYFKADAAWPGNPSGYYGDAIHFTNLGHVAHEIAVSNALQLATARAAA